MRGARCEVCQHTYTCTYTHAVTLGILGVFQMDYKMFGKLFSNVPPENFCGLVPHFAALLFSFRSSLWLSATRVEGGILDGGDG